MTKRRNVVGVTLLVVVILLVVIYGAFLSSKRAPNATIIYDAKKTIAGTGVTVAFPRDGYSGQGIALGYSRESSLRIFEKIANLYIVSKPSGIPQIEVSIYKLRNEKTLDETVEILTRDQNPEMASGSYQTINGTRYFIFSDSGGTINSAFALVKGNLLNVVMQNEPNQTVGVRPELFTQFLSHIDFSCATDCSVNAGPLVDMGKQGEE